jgi:hypothetical protein
MSAVKLYAVAFFATAFIAIAAIGLKAVWQAGYDARQTLSDSERASTLAANAKVAQGASYELSFNLGEASIFDAEASKVLTEIETYETANSSGTCGIPVDRMQLLQAFN